MALSFLSEGNGQTLCKFISTRHGSFERANSHGDITRGSGKALRRKLICILTKILQADGPLIPVSGF